VATGISFIAHSLALNPDIQDKLRKELKSVADKNNGKFTYDALKELKYMDMVIAGAQFWFIFVMS
jgi:cytochrome P450